MVAVGKPEDIFASLLPKSGEVGDVFCQTEVTSEETRVDRGIASAAAASLKPVWGRTMYHLDDLPFQPQDMQAVFTKFRFGVEKKGIPIRDPLPPLKKGDAPALPLADRTVLAAKAAGTVAGAGAGAAALPTTTTKTAAAAAASFDSVPSCEALGVSTPAADPRAAIPFAGGETAALARLEHYTFGTDALATYFETRNGMLGADYSTKLSPWLAHGCISPRRVYAECKRYEQARVANKSTYWVIFELMWRDFFVFLCMKVGTRIFQLDGLTGDNVAWGANPDHARRWKAGTTGWPLVDANMREMAATGFMSNRGRQNVASFLALDLQLDWRIGAEWFESVLVDYDVCSNWGNWAAAAGVTGGRVNKFNITKQSRDYDPKGDYIRHWIPELANVPAPKIFEPWAMSFADKEKFGCIEYPDPIRGGGARGMKSFQQRNGGGGSGGGRGGGGGGGGKRGRRNNGKEGRKDKRDFKTGGGGGGRRRGVAVGN